MNNILQLTIDGFSNLEEHGLKDDGTPDVRVIRGYKIEVVLNRAEILFSETLLAEKIPVDPTKFLADHLRRILAAYLPRVNPDHL